MKNSNIRTSIQHNKLLTMCACPPFLNDPFLLNSRMFGLYFIQPDQHALRDEPIEGPINAARRGVPIQIPVHERNDPQIIEQRKKINWIMNIIFITLCIVLIFSIFYVNNANDVNLLYNQLVNAYPFFASILGIFIIIGGEKIFI